MSLFAFSQRGPLLSGQFDMPIAARVIGLLIGSMSPVLTVSAMWSLGSRRAICIPTLFGEKPDETATLVQPGPYDPKPDGMWVIGYVYSIATYDLYNLTQDNPDFECWVDFPASAIRRTGGGESEHLDLPMDNEWAKSGTMTFNVSDTLWILQSPDVPSQSARIVVTAHANQGVGGISNIYSRGRHFLEHPDGGSTS